MCGWSCLTDNKQTSPPLHVASSKSLKNSSEQRNRS